MTNRSRVIAACARALERCRTHGSLLLLAGTLTLAGVHAALPPRQVELDMLDVGQGDAILIKDGFNQMLIDGGPDDTVLQRLGDQMPLFDRTIETVVLTHPHLDHFMGLIAVLGRYKVRTVVLGGHHPPGAEYARFEAAVAASGAQVIVARAGDALTLGPRTHFTVLWPSADAAIRARFDALKDENAASVVLHMETASGRSALLTGDATADVEAVLLRDDAAAVAAGRPDLLRADLLKVGHHGSRYSSTQAFLQAVHPAFGLISVGVGNKYNHPGIPTILRLRTLGARVFRTDLDGTVRATFAPDGIMVDARK